MTRRLGSLAVLTVLAVAPVLVAHSGWSHSSGRGPRVGCPRMGDVTSIAGENGRAVQWHPQAAPSDLPCFVERSTAAVSKARWPEPSGWKHRSSTSMRRARSRSTSRCSFGRASSRSGFREQRAGSMRRPLRRRLAESLPGRTCVSCQAGRRSSHSNANPITITSLETPTLRRCRLAPIASDFCSIAEWAGCPPPIAAAVLHDGKIAVSQTRGEALGDIILFENRDGATAYQAVRTSVCGSHVPAAESATAGAIAAGISRAGARGTWSVRPGSEGDGGKLAGFVVRARFATFLRRFEQRGRCDASAAHHPGAVGAEARVRGTHGSCDGKDARGSESRAREQRSANLCPVRALSAADRGSPRSPPSISRALADGAGRVWIDDELDAGLRTPGFRVYHIPRSFPATLIRAWPDAGASGRSSTSGHVIVLRTSPSRSWSGNGFSRRTRGGRRTSAGS